MPNHPSHSALSSKRFLNFLADGTLEQGSGATLCAATPMENHSVRIYGRRTAFSARRLMCAIVASVLLLALGLAQTASAQDSTDQLQFGQNYFVTGDYVVGGVGLRGMGDGTGYATGNIHIPDNQQPNPTAVPEGAQIVAALLYWETVESSQTSFAGQNGFFRPVLTSGGPQTGYPITGVLRGNPNAPVSWSSGGCAGNSQGSKTIRTYRADVRAYLPQDSEGNIIANGTYEVRLADSGSNGGGAPLTLGATLVIVYRAIAPDIPLNSVVIYDGAVAPSNGSSTMSQTMQGFYQAATNRVSKLTHIVGDGQSNKYETVSLNGVPLASLYGNGTLPAFPGFYNSSWDNPTWSFAGNNENPVPPNASSVMTSVVPSASNSGCVDWGAIIFSTTVQDSDGDGLLDVWEDHSPPGYCDASVNEGMCSTSDPSWVALPGAMEGPKDLFVQIDYMCSIVNPDGSCDTSNGYSFKPPPDALTMIKDAFASHNINVHFILGNAIQEQTCADTTDPSTEQDVLCPYPGQPGIVGWKAGFGFLKSQPLNYPDELSCEQALNGPCIRRFQHGRKDSYHYVLFAHALGLPQWSFAGGSLTNVEKSGNTVTFTTSAPHGLTAGTDPDRVTIMFAITDVSLNGTYMVHSTPDDYHFTIQTASSTTTPISYTPSTDPRLSVSSSQVRSISGFSDIGGADSLVTLGLWGPVGQTVNVQAGTLMHELGHSLGLTHGGFYYDQPGTYIPTVEANCKSNYQSVMNYLFQVDLLTDSQGNSHLDYSEEKLSPLNESSLPPGVTTIGGLAPFYSTTKWYTDSAPGGVGTEATHRCDGTPLQSSDRPMYRVEGPADPITPSWGSSSDINFDGTIFNGTFDNSDPSLNERLRGYADWAHVDLRQIGATASDLTGGAGGWGYGAGGWGYGAGGWGYGAGGWGYGAGGWGYGAGGWGYGAGAGDGGELTLKTANSVTRPPRKLTAAVTPPPCYIHLTWDAPTFGDIAWYNVYRSTNSTNLADAVKINESHVTSLTYTDTNVTCGPTYSYFVTAVIMVTDSSGQPSSQESVPSNATPPIKACAPLYTFTGFYSPLSAAGDSSYSGAFNTGKSVTMKWTLQDSSGNPVGNLSANTLLAVGPVASACSGGPAPVPVVLGYTGTYPYAYTTLYSPTSGAKGGSVFRISSSNNQFIFNWDTTGTAAGCYVIELDLDSGQVERTALNLR
jgi:hypothetical protein